MNGKEKTSCNFSTLSNPAAVIEAAENECAAIRKRYKKLAQDEYWKTVLDGKREADLISERLSSLAKLEAGKTILALKQDLIARTFSLASEKLSHLPCDEYVDFLARLAARASRTGDETVILPARDRLRYGKSVCMAANALLERDGQTANLTLSHETRDISGGLILDGGDVEVNCSTDTLVGLYKKELSLHILEMLFD
jgi:V/A-type H+-transporting ATPase subunit E